MARKIASVFSRPERQAQKSSAQAMDESTSIPASQTYESPSAASTDDPPVSAKEWKQTGTVSNVNGEGPARQRVF